MPATLLNGLLIGATTLPGSGVSGELRYRTDFRCWFQWDGSAWQQVSIGSFSGGFPSSPLTNLRVHRTDLSATYQYMGSSVWAPINAGPTFSVHKNGTDQTGVSGTAGVDTKITFSTALFNIDSVFNTSTGRFTPNVAGYYELIIGIYYSSMVDQVTMSTRIYKNGVAGRYSGAVKSSGTGGHGTTGTYIEYFNGSTDYAEAYCTQESGSIKTLLGLATLTYFSGGLYRRDNL